METPQARPFVKLAVVGAGNMGSGIAQKIATEGIEVVMVDLDDEKVASGLENIRRTLDEGVQRKIFRKEVVEAVLGRVQATADWTKLSDVDLVVEAVFEDRSVKQEVFSRLDEICPPGTILATNTSSLSVTELAAATRRPERVLGLHYFYHPAKNRLVEVIPGRATDAAVRRRAWTLQEQLGKTPIASADRPGFIVNRYFVPWLNEAVRLLEEGVADIPTIEKASKDAFGVGMGPFQLMNVTGIPIALHAATTLGEALGPFYAPVDMLRKQVESGRTWDLDGSPDPSKFAEVSDRLLAVTFYVAAALVSEEVGTVEDTDIGARVGLRWPHGPFKLMNRQGVDRAAALVADLSKRNGLSTPGILKSHARSCKPFVFHLVRSEIREDIACLTINRPDAMNALNESVVAQLHDAFRQAASNPQVRGIVLAGAGKAFVAGADIRFFVRNIEEGKVERIAEFTRAGHALLNEIDQCPKPVVASVDGLTLGGGLELALVCDAILATPKSSMAFPETGIGIYPGLGGTQRTAKRIGQGLAKWLIFTGQMVTARDAQAIGLIDRVVAHDELDRAIRDAVESEGRLGPRREPLPERYRDLEAFFGGNSASDLHEGKVDSRGNELLAKAMKRVGTKAPIALRLAERLIVEGSELPLEKGLQMELDHLEEIFTTRDAHEGLSTLGKKTPVFEGR